MVLDVGCAFRRAGFRLQVFDRSAPWITGGRRVSGRYRLEIGEAGTEDERGSELKQYPVHDVSCAVVPEESFHDVEGHAFEPAWRFCRRLAVTGTRVLIEMRTAGPT
jgi:hypothetical protein